jgi:peptidoglycan/LPS O-acetylase OafA/YrhL
LQTKRYIENNDSLTSIHQYSPNSARAYYPALDGVRGLAILMVVFFHNFGFANYFYFGWLGVDLFFVLSGFLITEILLKTVGKSNYLKNFFLKRALRIFPLYYTVLIVSIFFLSLIPTLGDNLGYYVDNQIWLWTFLQNWLFIFNEPEKTNFLVHFWSLAVEEQFYLVWPFLILFVRKPKVLLVLVSTILLFIIFLRVWLWTNHVQLQNYFNPYTFTRFDGICIGCMLALIMTINFNFLRKYNTVIVLTLAVLNFIFYFLNKASSYALPYLPFFGYTSFAFVFAFLIYEAVAGKNKLVNYIFRLPALKFLGKISYGLYVFHWPIYLALFPKLVATLNHSLNLNVHSSQIASSLIATLIGLGVSIISYYTFETKFLRLKNKI